MTLHDLSSITEESAEALMIDGLSKVIKNGEFRLSADFLLGYATAFALFLSIPINERRGNCVKFDIVNIVKLAIDKSKI